MALAAGRPAVSAVLLSYDCENFIGTAIESALAQDYDGPLEIVVSDDASSDSSFVIAREHLARYRGPHRVAARQREVNSGSKSAHLNDVLPHCSGEILVSFDGDDIAEPARVRALVARFLAHENVQAVYSSLSVIDERGNDSGPAKVPHPPATADAPEWFARVDAYAAGSTLAVRRGVIEDFGPLEPSVNEDIVLPFRASLIGQVRFIDEPLVRYRRHSASLTANWRQFESLERYRARLHGGVEGAARARRCRLSDLEWIATKRPQESSRWQQLRSIVERSFRHAELSRDLANDSAAARLRSLLALTCAGAYRTEWTQHAFLALAPDLYLRYRRRKLASLSRAGAAGRGVP
jgi:glycosyltransferase involved in cell wall biosynthesis